MSYLENYLDRAENERAGSAVSLRHSAQDFTEEHLKEFSFNEHANGLLFGHVQSGKTEQMFGVASAAADAGFRLFVLVTTDNILLQRQTFERAKRMLGGFMDGFIVMGETDDDEFLALSNPQNPILVVLKKNVRVLRHWSNHIAQNPYFSDSPIFVLDDEGDAASLNTLVNKDDQSTINGLLEKIRHQSPSSFFLHVTATPQSLLLQAQDSSWRPDFAHYIAPGSRYLGGDFFYAEESAAVRYTPDDEKEILLKTGDVPEGLRKAVLSFLVAGAHTLLTKERDVCTLLIHPGIRIKEHEVAKEKVERFLEGVKTDLLNDSEVFVFDIRDAWNDLKTTKADLSLLDDILSFLRKGLPQINIVALNSNTPEGTHYNEGLNIVVGGNNLGRGVTFPGLNTVYYCRSAKTPQADTCWQHARIFGYDRDPGLARIFSPQPLVKLFRELNEANNALFAVLREKGPHAVSVLAPKGTRPTRRNVVKTDDLAILAGGVNYFPSFPKETNLSKLDGLIGTQNDDRRSSLSEFLEVLELVKVENGDPWKSHNFPSCIQALLEAQKSHRCRLIIRTDRSISRGTGTLLSPDDRRLGKEYEDHHVLIMYRLRGEEEKGWNGKPLWVPNIKFADGTCFYLSTK